MTIPMTNTLFENITSKINAVRLDAQERALVILFSDISAARQAHELLMISFGAKIGEKPIYHPLNSLGKMLPLGSLFLNEIPRGIIIRKDRYVRLSYKNMSCNRMATGQCFRII